MKRKWKSGRTAGMIVALVVFLAVGMTACGQEDSPGQRTQTGEAQSAEAQTGGEQIANPFTDCADLQEAEEIAGFSITIPEKLSADYTELTYRAIEGELIEVIYRQPGQEDEIRIRKAIGEGDISGDYREYGIVETAEEESSGAQVTMKGEDKESEERQAAIWENDGYAYSLTTDQGIDRQELIKILQTIQ
ncbi:MAG: hypothetical protein Q4C60_06430 [Eubacteriales bacterium]|nr:hypothetical protein [Eubacteriales bacterium]